MVTLIFHMSHRQQKLLLISTKLVQLSCCWTKTVEILRYTLVMEEHFLLKLLLLEQLVLKLIGFHIAKYSLTGKREYLTSGHFPLKMITFSYGFWSYFRCLLCNPRSSYRISWKFVHLLHKTRDHNHHPNRMLCMLMGNIHGVLAHLEYAW